VTIETAGVIRADGGALMFSLPWPPSVNHYWRSVTIAGRARMLISRQGRDYARQVRAHLALYGLPKGAAFGSAPIELCIRAHPPDRRKRDLDNLLKPTLDALTSAGLWEDDAQIADLRIVRMFPSEAPRLEVLARAVNPPREMQQSL
jgi:Holliday junction resolvase